MKVHDLMHLSEMRKINEKVNLKHVEMRVYF